MERRKPQGLFVGGPTILMVLLVLCLAVFAMITLGSARENMLFAEKTAQATSEYYDASVEVMEIIAVIPEDPDDAASLLCDVGVGNIYDEGRDVLTFWYPVGDQMTLEIDLRLGDGVTVERFQVVPSNMMFEEEYLPLM